MWSGKKMANSRETHNILPVIILSVSTLISQLGIIIGGYINDRGKCGSGKNMAKLSKTRHFIPFIIIPSKVHEKMATGLGTSSQCITLMSYEYHPLAQIIC